MLEKVSYAAEEAHHLLQSVTGAYVCPLSKDIPSTVIFVSAVHYYRHCGSGAYSRNTRSDTRIHCPCKLNKKVNPFTVCCELRSDQLSVTDPQVAHRYPI